MIRITNLALRDFQGHARIDLAPGKLTIIRGANGSGKSSLRRAVEWVLTGQVSDLGVSGKSAAEVLVRGAGTAEGATKASVVADLGESGKILREVPNRLRIRRPDGTEATGEDPLRKSFRLPAKEAVALACNPHLLTDMKPDDLRDLLFALLTDGMSREEVLSATQEWLATKTTATPDAIVSWANARLPDWPDAAHLERLYKEAYGDRREANGAVRTLKQQLESLKTTGKSAPAASPQELEQTKTRLVGLRQRAQALQQQVAAAQQAQAKKSAARQTMDAAEQELADLRVKTGVAEGTGRPGDEGALRHQVDVLKQQIRTVREQNGACPVYAGVSCPLPPSAVKEHVEGLSRQRQVKVAELAQVVIWDAAARLDAATKAWATLPDADPSTAERELAGLNRQIDVETERLTQLAAATGLQAGARETAARLRQQLKEAEAQAGLLQLAVKCFDSDGMRSLLVARRLRGLQSRIDEGLERLLGPGWSVRLDAGSPHPIMLRHPRHGAAVLKSLSTAERTLVAVAVLDALNDFTELGLLCLDDLEHLVPENRERLMAALREWAGAGRYGTILALSADGRVDELQVTVEA